MHVIEKEGFQSRESAKRIYSGPECGILLPSCAVQGQVDEIGRSELVDRDNVCVDEQFAKGGKLLPRFVYPLHRIPPSKEPSNGTQEQPLHGRSGKLEQL